MYRSWIKKALVTLPIAFGIGQALELSAPFSGLPTLDALGGEGNPAAAGFHPLRALALDLDFDSAGAGRFDPAAYSLLGRWNTLSAGYKAVFRQGSYAGQEIRLGLAAPLGPLGWAGSTLRRTESGPDLRYGLDLGWQAAPWPQLRLGYVLRDAWGTGSKPPWTHSFAAGLRPLGHSPKDLGRLEIGGGAEVLRASEHPFAYARLPLGGRLSALGLWEFRETRGTMALAAVLGPKLHLGLSGDATRGGLRLARVSPPVPRYIGPRPCARVLDLNHSVALGSRAGLFAAPGLDLESLLRRFDFLEADPQARVIWLKLGKMRTNFAVAEEIHRRVLRLRRAGKRVFATLDPAATPMNYFVASAAQRIAAHPAGHFSVAGFSSEATFFKGFLDKIGVEAQFLRHGKYKSFGEPFTRTGFSPEAEENLRTLLNGWWDHYVETIAAAREIPPERLRAYLDRGELDLDSARAHGLIDTLLHSDQVPGALGLGREMPLCPANEEGAGPDPRWGAPQTVALLAWNGDIVSGSGGLGLFGGESISQDAAVRQLRRLRRSGVRAVVLRLDSPGGLAQASDAIAREVDRLRESGKKVVVAVGAAAASGAYYIACRADAIVAEPASVIGSIGVVWGKAVTRGLYDKLGLTREGLKTAPHADAQSSARPWSEEEIRVLQAHLDRFYANFLDKVKQGRRGKIAHPDSAAEGRVFTGKQALALGLVDTLGGVETALSLAARMAGLPDWQPRRVRRIESGPTWPGEGLLGKSPGMPVQIRTWVETWTPPQAWALDPALAAALGPMP